MRSRDTDPYGCIITFYSYKGGTGRSMALANIACLLGRRVGKGKRILAIDWDLEAPGLHRYFAGSRDDSRFRKQPGLIDYFTDAVHLLREQPGLHDSLSRSEGRETLHKLIPIEKHVITDIVDNLDLLTAGRVGGDAYMQQVHRFDWQRLHDDYPLLLEAFRDFVAERWSYVLIDSRTGLTDIGGICTAFMPEKLVTVFTPNRQSLEGLLDVIRQAVSYRRHSDDFRPLSVFPLPSRIDLSEERLRREWREDYERQLKELFERTYLEDGIDLGDYLDEVQIPQKSYYAYGERIAVLEEVRSESLSLSRAYENFCDRLGGLDQAWAGTPTRVLTGDWLVVQRRRTGLLAAWLLLSLVAGSVGMLASYVYWAPLRAETAATALVLFASAGLAGGSIAGFSSLRASRIVSGLLNRRSYVSGLLQPIMGCLLGLATGVVYQFSVFNSSSTFGTAAALCLLAGLYANQASTKLRETLERTLSVTSDDRRRDRAPAR